MKRFQNLHFMFISSFYTVTMFLRADIAFEQIQNRRFSP